MFQDHFSKQAADYARFRPIYPAELYLFLAQQSPANGLAWDCGCGNGQVAIRLANHFARVEASDPSQAQLDHAKPHERVTYHRAAESAPFLTDHSLDLITVAQALHWFDLDCFADEVERTLGNGGIVAAWCYGLLRTDSHLDPIIEAFYGETIGPYWPPERRHIDLGYSQLKLPGTPIDTPPFAIHRRWGIDELIGYISTWSAVQRYRAKTGEDPIPALRGALSRAWVSDRLGEIYWPIHLLVNRI